MVPLTKRNLFVDVRRVGTHTPRDFLFFKGDPLNGGVLVEPMELLSLRQAFQVIREQSGQAIGLPLALSRLLAPCLQYAGSGRHIVVERWEATDVRGESLPADTRTRLASALAREQADEWKWVASGRRPPKGSLADAFWEAQTDLPLLPPQFDDTELGRMAKALYLFLVPSGNAPAAICTAEVMSKVAGLQKSGFQELELGGSPRRLKALFRKLLAVTVIWSSQLTGEVALRVVHEFLVHHWNADRPQLSEDERALLELRYGACPDLSNVNVGFFYGNGPLVGLLLNNLYWHYAFASPRSEREKAAAELHKCMHLVRSFRHRRSAARAEERRENRQRRPRSGRPAPRRAEHEADPKAAAPDARPEARDELAFLRERLTDLLRPRDLRRLEAYLMAGGDYAEAARQLGTTREKFARQWRQTTLPNIRRAIRRLDDAED